MPAGHGVRARTRDLFARGFRKKGTIHLSTYLRTYRIGEYVDIKVNGAVHKGMPHKFYHGRTGRVWNVTKRAIGVEMNKQVISPFWYFPLSKHYQFLFGTFYVSTFLYPFILCVNLGLMCLLVKICAARFFLLMPLILSCIRLRFSLVFKSLLVNLAD